MTAAPFNGQQVLPGTDASQAAPSGGRPDTRQHEMDAMARFASRAAHDLSDILTLFLGTSSLLLDELPLDHPRRAQVEQVEIVARRATILTRQLSVLSRHLQLAPPHERFDGRGLRLVRGEGPRTGGLRES